MVSVFETGNQSPFKNSLCQVRKGIGMEGTGPDPSFFGQQQHCIMLKLLSINGQCLGTVLIVLGQLLRTPGSNVTVTPIPSRLCILLKAFFYPCMHSDMILYMVTLFWCLWLQNMEQGTGLFVATNHQSNTHCLCESMHVQFELTHSLSLHKLPEPFSLL